MTREEAIERFNGIINAMSISIAQAKFYPSKAELDELCGMAIEALQREDRFLKSMDTNEPLYTEVVRCKDCRWWNCKNLNYQHNNHLCRYWSKFGSIDTSADNFCSYGERREP